MGSQISFFGLELEHPSLVHIIYNKKWQFHFGYIRLVNCELDGKGNTSDIFFRLWKKLVSSLQRAWALCHAINSLSYAMNL